jgi:hypothetical protein
VQVKKIPHCRSVIVECLTYLTLTLTAVLNANCLTAFGLDSTQICGQICPRRPLKTEMGQNIPGHENHIAVTTTGSVHSELAYTLLPGTEHTLGPVQRKKLGCKHLQLPLYDLVSHKLATILSKQIVLPR